MSDFTEWVQDEIAVRPSVDVIAATGSILVKADNIFSRDYEALSQGTTDQILKSNGTGAVPTWVDLSVLGDPRYYTQTQLGSTGLNHTCGADLIGCSSLAGSTINNLHDMLNDFLSSGKSSGGIITDGGSQTVDVSGGTGYIRATNDQAAELISFDWPSVSGIAIPTDTHRHIGVEWNDGTPQVVSRSSYDWNYNTDFPLGVVVNEDDVIIDFNNGWWVTDGISSIIQRFDSDGNVVRSKSVGGLILGVTGTRNLTLSSGVLWFRFNRDIIPEIDTSVSGDFTLYYVDNANDWHVDIGETAYPVTDYNDTTQPPGSELVTLHNNYYATWWVYILMNGSLALIYPQEQYANTAAAEAASPPLTVPDAIAEFGLLVGRIIFREGVDAPVTVQSAFTTQFTAGQAADHGNLTGLTDDDHLQYHNDTRGDARYYTQTLLDAGQLDNRYFTESEHIDVSAGAGDAGKPVILNASGDIDNTMIAVPIPDDPNPYPIGSSAKYTLMWDDGEPSPEWDLRLSLPSITSGREYLRISDFNAPEWAGSGFIDTYMLYCDSNGEITGTDLMTFDGTRPTFTNGVDLGYDETAVGAAAFPSGIYVNGLNGQLKNYWIPRKANLNNGWIIDYQDELFYRDRIADSYSWSPSPNSYTGSTDGCVFIDNSEYVQWNSGTSPGDIVLTIDTSSNPITNKSSAYWTLGLTFRYGSMCNHIKLEVDAGSGYVTEYDDDVVAADGWVSPRFATASPYDIDKIRITFTTSPNPMTSAFRIQRVMLYHYTAAWDPWHLHIGGGQMFGNISFYDDEGIVFGDGADASIVWNGTNLVIDTGTGLLDVVGTLQTDGYNSADGTAGATADVAVAKVGGGTRTLHFKNGLYTSYTDS